MFSPLQFVSREMIMQLLSTKGNIILPFMWIKQTVLSHVQLERLLVALSCLHTVYFMIGLKAKQKNRLITQHKVIYTMLFI